MHPSKADIVYIKSGDLLHLLVPPSMATPTASPLHAAIAVGAAGNLPAGGANAIRTGSWAQALCAEDLLGRGSVCPARSSQVHSDMLTTTHTRVHPPILWWQNPISHIGHLRNFSRGPPRYP